ncbi:DAK2 domain protein [Candidatus Tiddalikarchaeum anstoanum]|nr:DAK2 domain protein [Candidatus Tiddalikarchaeum anstoanum]
MKVLEVNHFKNMINETVKVIEDKKDYLNYINVYPVRDGDTGNNLLSTFKNTRLLNEKANVKDFLIDLKKLVLTGARGNSGVIISQFYKGFCNHLIGSKNIGTFEFAKAIENGYYQAYNSVSKPAEGTMLSVLKGASIGAIKVLKKSESVIDVLESSFKSAQKYLKKTVKQIPILNKSGVVDAGGLGVVYMLGAWMRAIGVLPKYDPSINNLILKEPLSSGIKNKYCISVLIKDCKHEKELKDLLNSLGDSLDIGGDINAVKVHIHANDYENVKAVCSAFGELSSFEYDNMMEQNEKIREYKNNNG